MHATPLAPVVAEPTVLPPCWTAKVTLASGCAPWPGTLWVLDTLTVPRFSTLLNVQVTVWPGLITTAVTGLPLSQDDAGVPGAQLVGSVPSATLYVPALTAPESWD